MTKSSGGMVVKQDRNEPPYAAMQMAIQVAQNVRDKGITGVHVRVRAPGRGNSGAPVPEHRQRSRLARAG